MCVCVCERERERKRERERRVRVFSFCVFKVVNGFVTHVIFIIPFVKDIMVTFLNQFISRFSSYNHFGDSETN